MKAREKLKLYTAKYEALTRRNVVQLKRERGRVEEKQKERKRRTRFINERKRFAWNPGSP